MTERSSIAVISSIAYSLPNFRGPLIREMIARGWTVYALAPDYDQGLRDRVRALGAVPVDFSMERTGMRPARDLADAVRLARLLRRLRVTAVFGYFIKPVIYGTLAATLARVPRRYALIAGLGYVFTSDGGADTAKRKALRLVVSTLFRSTLAFADRVFFQNQDDLDHFVEGGLIARDKGVRLNGTGVDLERLREVPPPGGPPVFLLMARLLREKGIFEYVEAARQLKRETPSARFVLLGGLDPNPGGIDAAQVAAWIAEGAVECPGHVDDVRPWLEGCSVYVLPSYREGSPRSTQEAMAIGRAVVTTDAIGCRDTVVEQVNGFKVPVRDAGALAAAMRRFIADPGLIATMGRASRARAEERYDTRVINDVMLAHMEIAPR